MTAQPDLQTYAAAAEAWLAGNSTPRPEAAGAGPEKAWGSGSDDVSIFHDLTDDEERTVLDRAMAWQVRKYDAGYGAIDWPTEAGGAGHTPEHLHAFEAIESRYETPVHHETFSVTRNLVAPTLLAFAAVVGWFPLRGRDRALLAVTLVAALASTIFMPL